MMEIHTSHGLLGLVGLFIRANVQATGGRWTTFKKIKSKIP